MMFTVILYILRWMVWSNTSENAKAQKLLESFVAGIKTHDLQGLEREEIDLKTSHPWNPNHPDYKNRLELINYRRREVVVSGIDQFVRGWWFRRHRPSHVIVEPAPEELITSLEVDSIKQAARLCLDFLVEDQPEIRGLNHQATVSNLANLMTLLDLSSTELLAPAQERLGANFSAWSLCGGERGRSNWFYRDLTTVVSPSA